jgi:hypothetical protein
MINMPIQIGILIALIWSTMFVLIMIKKVIGWNKYGDNTKQ